MDVDSLHLFVKVAATGSFTRAASLVGATQSSVSKRIADLEQECGRPLFDRTGRGVSLNEAGRWLLPRAESLTAEMSGLAANLSSAFAAPQGLVRLAVQPSVAWPLIDDVHSRVKAAYPGVRLQVLEGPTGDVEQWLREGRVDLALVNRGVQHNTDRATYLFSTVFYLISRPGDRLTQRRAIRFSEIHELPLVVAALPNGGRVLLDEAAKRANITLEIVIEVNSANLLKSLVAAGHGYGVTSLNSIAAELAARSLQACRITSPQLEEHFSLIGGYSRHPNLAVQTIAAVVREVATRRPRAQEASNRVKRPRRESTAARP